MIHLYSDALLLAWAVPFVFFIMSIPRVIALTIGGKRTVFSIGKHDGCPEPTAVDGPFGINAIQPNVEFACRVVLEPSLGNQPKVRESLLLHVVEYGRRHFRLPCMVTVRMFRNHAVYVMANHRIAAGVFHEHDIAHSEVLSIIYQDLPQGPMTSRRKRVVGLSYGIKPIELLNGRIRFQYRDIVRR